MQENRENDGFYPSPTESFQDPLTILALMFHIYNPVTFNEKQKISQVETDINCFELSLNIVKLCLHSTKMNMYSDNTESFPCPIHRTKKKNE